MYRRLYSVTETRHHHSLPPFQLPPMDVFFSGKLTTQKDCDLLAESLCGGTVEPAPVPGGYSYTVITTSGEVVQFRPADSKLPDPNAILFRVFASAHPGLVAVHQKCGTLGTLEVYRMPKLEGVCYPKALACYNKLKRRQDLVEDLAQYVSLIPQLQLECKAKAAKQLTCGHFPFLLGSLLGLCKPRGSHSASTPTSRFKSRVYLCGDSTISPRRFQTVSGPSSSW